MPRRRRTPPEQESQPPADLDDEATPVRVLDANQVVAYNFRAARELRGWTQDHVAYLLAQYLGQQLPKASISAIERSVESDRRREFDAQELVAFALTFDLPVIWFLLPPPGAEEYQLAGTERSVLHLVRLLFGREGELQDLRVRFAELKPNWFSSDPKAGERLMEEASDFPEDLSWTHFERARQEALLALVDQDANEIEQLVGELSRVLAKFDQFSMKTYRETHPKKVYRDISNSILGQRIFRLLSDLEADDPDRYTFLRTVLLDAGPALEQAVDLDDQETVDRLAALLDRVEERLRGEP
ncbi:MAG TPA: helix-turn-helix transcriptional regulator [Acidimicrobiia bacterium]|nr:helix-turn-helix transcriptional regulator [Acidimicrobiia bacterium]